MPDYKKKKDEPVIRFPVNYEAEQSLLCCLIIEAGVAAEYASLLHEEDFFLPQNKVIITAIKDMVREDVTVNMVTLTDSLIVKGKLNDAGGMEYLMKVQATEPSAASVEQYYKIVQRDSVLRQIINAGKNITAAGSSTDNKDEALLAAEKEIFSISERNESSKLTPIGATSGLIVDKITAMQRGTYVEEGIRTGYTILDKTLGPLEPGALIILAARPSIGKTAFALTIALNAAIKANKKVAVFSYEMPIGQLVQRMLTTLSQVGNDKQKIKGGMSLNDTKNLLKAHEALTNAGIYVDENTANTPADIVSKCRRMKHTDGLDLVIVDYMQLINVGERRENRQQEVSEISRKMKLYAKDVGVPFIVLSQMSRVSERLGDEPSLPDLRESGSIEQDADKVIFLHRPKPVENPKSDEALFVARNFPDQGKRGKQFIKLLVAKNRNGEMGACYYSFDGSVQTFFPIDIRELSTDEDAPAVKVNTEITTKKQLDQELGDDIFDDMMAVGKGTVEEIADDVSVNDEIAKDEIEAGESAPIPVNAPTLDTSDTDEMVFTNNEPGDQSMTGDADGNNGNLPW